MTMEGLRLCRQQTTFPPVPKEKNRVRQLTTAKTAENGEVSTPTDNRKIRRTPVMITRENKQILDYILKGASHEQIMKWIGLNEKNYWKRIAAIRKRDMELTKAEQTPEAHAFLYKRTQQKFYHLESMAIQIAESKYERAGDRIEAMKFLRQLTIDQYSIFIYGPHYFLTRNQGQGAPAINVDDVDDDLGLNDESKRAF